MAEANLPPKEREPTRHYLDKKEPKTKEISVEEVAILEKRKKPVPKTALTITKRIDEEQQSSHSTATGVMIGGGTGSQATAVQGNDARIGCTGSPAIPLQGTGVRIEGTGCGAVAVQSEGMRIGGTGSPATSVQARSLIISGNKGQAMPATQEPTRDYLDNKEPKAKELSIKEVAILEKRKKLVPETTVTITKRIEEGQHSTTRARMDSAQQDNGKGNLHQQTVWSPSQDDTGKGILTQPTDILPAAGHASAEQSDANEMNEADEEQPKQGDALDEKEGHPEEDT